MYLGREFRHVGHVSERPECIQRSNHTQALRVGNGHSNEFVANPGRKGLIGDRNHTLHHANGESYIYESEEKTRNLLTTWK
jgi:hypothetical protein